MRGSYFWLRTTRLSTRWLQAYQQKDGLSHYQNSMSLLAFSSILKDFWEPMSIDARVVLLVEDDKTMYTMATSVSTKRWILTLPKFDEPFGFWFHFERFLGIDVGRCEGHTFGWGRQDYVHDGYKRINEKMDSHITKIRRAFWRSIPFWNIFGNRCR